MKTIIHIGQHKTGTTSIQKFLQDNKAALKKSGLYVPSSIAGYDHPSHFILNVYTLAKDSFSQKKREIIAKMGEGYINDLGAILDKDIERIYAEALDSECDRVLWSNEGLYLLNSISEYEKLKSLFSRYSSEIEVVCCFRDIAYRESYYRVKKKEYIEPNGEKKIKYEGRYSWLFDDDRKKELLSGVFDKCTYFSYNSDNNIETFMHAVGLAGHIDMDDSVYRLNVTADKNR